LENDQQKPSDIVLNTASIQKMMNILFYVTIFYELADYKSFNNDNQLHK